MFSITKIVLTVLLFHFIADFTLQGWLAQSKCKEWWLKNAPDRKYEKDYICCLLCHGAYWSLFTYLPLIIFVVGADIKLCIILLINTIVHAFIDDLKANWKLINLFEDQMFHAMQIAVTISMFII